MKEIFSQYGELIASLISASLFILLVLGLIYGSTFASVISHYVSGICG